MSDIGCGNRFVCPCMSPCPVAYAMKIIGGKWKIPILCILRLEGAVRYNTILRKVNGITNTMLASSLKELEADGLVSRVQYPEIPVRVEYSLTDACENLLPALDILWDWSRSMMERNGIESE